MPSLGRRPAVLGGDEVWVTDTALDIRAHVLDGLGSRPLSSSALELRVAELFPERLDRSRPL